MIIPLTVSAIAVVITLLYASARDIVERRVPFRTWYPMLVIGIPLVAWFYGSLFLSGFWSLALAYLVLVAVFSLLFYSFAYLHLFGGADAYALIFLSVLVPAFPFEPAFGVPPLGFFPFSVLVNALILNLVTPAGIFAYNVAKGNRAPVANMFLGFPVDGKTIANSFGYIMEDIREDDDGRITRRFLSFSEALKGMMKGSGRVYTLDLRRNPDEYREELSLYSRAGKVWISYGVPFIVPLTAGMIVALFAGDILVIMMQLLI
ncbi:preflagellin peptidase FlaK [Methanolinea mesophila]|uniref:A24 family peptidase C-terminal domain-containing protein n=1 Tax=Methanolinea mesophila TaxID=547055 RepID=UPI001AE61F2E|nr:A24 family peptidase C-terminal domain-containing protein [Methanolinea mesophila]MBP1929394.1 preflagellin peptidase FlaK [Methanolinea mesophila]